MNPNLAALPCQHRLPLAAPQLCAALPNPLSAASPAHARGDRFGRGHSASGVAA